MTPSSSHLGVKEYGNTRGPAISIQLPELELWSYIPCPDQPDHGEIIQSLVESRSLAISFEECAQWLTHDLNRINPSGISLHLSAGTRRTPQHGTISFFPIYAALASQCRPNQAAAADLFKAVLLIATAQTKDLALGTKNASIRETAGLAVRRICLKPSMFEAVQPLVTSSFDSVRDVETAIQERLADPNIQVSPRDRALLDGLSRYILYACKEKKPPNRPGAGTGQEKEEEDSPPSESGPPVRTREFRPVPRLSDVERAIRLKHGAAPVRESSPPLDFEVQEKARPGRTNFRMLALKARTRSRAIAASAQHLAFGSDRLQLLDLAALFKWCTREFGDSQEEKAYQAVADILLAMLFTGSSLDDAWAAQAVANCTPNDRQIRTFGVVESPLSWLLPGPGLTDGFKPIGPEEALYRPTCSHLLVPVPEVFVKLRARLTRNPGEKLFPRGSIDTWKQWARKALAQINKESDSRLTLIRISGFLQEFTAFLIGDHADGAFFSPRHDATGCSARLYYYSPSAQRIADIYREVWDTVAKSLRIYPKGLNWSWTQLPPAYQGQSIGSGGCPVDDAVIATMTALRNRTIQIVKRPGRPTNDQSSKLHNALTAYTAFMVMWCGALRAVNDPLVLGLIDAENGYLAISEKDSDDYALSRIIWLPSVVQEQLRFYAEHRRVLLALSRKRGKKGKRGITRLEDPETWCFFIENGKPVPVTPTRLMEELGDAYPLRLNAQRHYLRTVLREKGVRGAIVDALLGHGGFGEEPYARYSAFSPRQMRNELDPVLTDLLTQMGWAAIPGLRT